MRLTENDDMIQALAADRPDQPFGKAILPRRGWCNWLVPNAHSAQSTCDDGAINAIPVSDHVAGSPVPRKCLRYLACNPFCRRIPCDVNPDQISAVKLDDDECREQVETDSRNNEQVHRGNVRRVVTQEGQPSPAWRPASLDHVLGDAGLSDLKPKFEKFAVDAWRAPKRVLHAHLPDQRAQPRLDLRPASQRS